MSFLTDLFEGKTSNLGKDLNPSNIFSDTGKDIAKNPLLDAGLLVGGGLLTAGLADPALLGLAGAGAADAGAAGGIDAITTGEAVGAADATAGLTGAGAATAGLDAGALGLDATSALSFAGPDAAASGGGIDAITSALGTAGTGATGAGGASSALSILPNAATAASDAGTLSIPGVADSSVAAGDVTNLGASGATSSPSFFDSLVSGATKSVTSNPLGIAVAGGLLGYDVLKGNPNSAAENSLAGSAGSLATTGAAVTATGTQLNSYLQNGTLPPGQQAQVTQAVQAAKAKIIANAAANGQNTNPTQNSGLAQDLANADLNGLAMAGQLETNLATAGTNLINTGLHATGLSSQIYEALIKIDQTNNNQLMTAIAGMAAALSGGTKISIGNTAPAAA